MEANNRAYYYGVHVEHYYYNNTYRRPIDGIVAVYDTREAAQEEARRRRREELISRDNDGWMYLDHNEYAAPWYSVALIGHQQRERVLAEIERYNSHACVPVRGRELKRLVCAS